MGSRGNDLLCRGNDLLSRGNELLGRPNDLLSRLNDLLSRGNELKVVRTTYFSNSLSRDKARKDSLKK